MLYTICLVGGFILNGYLLYLAIRDQEIDNEKH